DLDRERVTLPGITQLDEAAVFDPHVACVLGLELATGRPLQLRESDGELRVREILAADDHSLEVAPDVRGDHPVSREGSRIGRHEDLTDSDTPGDRTRMERAG